MNPLQTLPVTYRLLTRQPHAEMTVWQVCPSAPRCMCIRTHRLMDENGMGKRGETSLPYSVERTSHLQFVLYYLHLHSTWKSFEIPRESCWRGFCVNKRAMRVREKKGIMQGAKAPVATWPGVLVQLSSSPLTLRPCSSRCCACLSGRLPHQNQAIT